MNFQINLEKKSYHWFKYGQTSICGFCFIGGEIYHAEKLARYIDELPENDVKDFLEVALGEFAIVKTGKEKLIACADNIRSYPLFYCLEKNTFFLTDSAEIIINSCKSKISKEHSSEYLAAGFVSGKNTLFYNLFTIQAGEFIQKDLENSKKPESKSYYLYDSSTNCNCSKNELLLEHDIIIDQVFERLIKTLNNRQVLVPLSGGFDSRLVVQMLKRKGYENVICFSYGNIHSKECIYSKQIADSLNYKWYHVDLTLKKWKDISKTLEYQQYLFNSISCAAIPYIQHYVPVYILLHGNYGITSDCIVITGNSGDFLEGKNIHKSVFDYESYTRNELLQYIAKQHYILNGKSVYKDEGILNLISNNIIEGKEFLTDNFVRITERFNWRERQSKYVVADSRAYEALGLEWRLPLWDKELMIFWENVSPRVRAERSLYYQFIKNENIGNANQTTNYQKFVKSFVKLFPLLTDFVIIIKRLGEYFTHQHHWYGIVSFWTYLKALLKTRGASGFSICTIVSRELINYFRNKYGDIND